MTFVKKGFNNMEPHDTVTLIELITTAIAKCTDPSILDLVYKILTMEI